MTYDPDKLRDLIPEYLNETLSRQERTEFEQGLDTYPELKNELQAFAEIKSAYKAMQDEIPAPPDAVFKKVMHRIKAEQKSTASGDLGFFEQLRRFFAPLFASPRVSWAVAGVQMAVILLLLVSVPKEGRFTTLTSQHAGQIDGATINIVFDPDTREMEIRQILGLVEADIIHGPSSEGLYTIKIHEDRDSEQTIEALKEYKAVRFAEKGYVNGSR